MTLSKMGYGLVLIFFVYTGCATTGSMRNPLIEAVESGNLDEVKLQLKMGYGDARHMRDKNGKTLLHLATEYGHANIVQYLLANGMNPDTTDRIGDTTLQIAAYNGYADIAEQLITAGANVNTANSYGITPLLNALFNQQYDIARLLVRNGANIHSKSVNGSPALHVA
ncbi:MAG: ankyrin repeat domain-containing protein, partial [Desulfobacterales bacterium]|nr:ankyrin repeat domain-containing protein [Desulfobacterales bacterium]